MASKIRVNTNSLHHTQQTVQGRLDQIKRGLDQIVADMATMNSMWAGEAHDVFEVSIDADIQYLQSACEGIQKVIEYERGAVTEFNRCEQQISEIISQIRI